MSFHGYPVFWSRVQSRFTLYCFLFFFFFRVANIKFIYLFIYLWLCWVFVSVRGLSLVVASGGHSSSRCVGLSLSRLLLLRSTGSRRTGSVIVAHGPTCSAACGIFPDQGSNPCPLHWQADSQPLRHQGSPVVFPLPSGVSSNQEESSPLTSYFLSRHWLFWRIQANWSWRMSPILKLSDCFPTIRFELNIFAENATLVILYTSASSYQGPVKLMPSLITFLWWCSPNLFKARMYFPFVKS